MEEQLEQYRRQFFQEALDILDKANEDILKAEADPENKELLNAIFRGIHTIKGSAGTFGVDDLSEFSHHLEALLSALREGVCLLNPDITDVILRALDVLNVMIEGHKNGSPVSADEQVVADIQALLPSKEQLGHKNKTEPQSSKSENRISLPQQVSESFKKYIEQGLSIYKIEPVYTDELFANGYDQQIFMSNLKEMCSGYIAISCPDAVPWVGDFNPLALYIHPVIYTATAMSKEEINDLAFDQSLIKVEQVFTSGMEKMHGERFVEAENVEQQILQEFVASSQEGITALELAALQFEKDGASSALQEIFRIVHNIKGDANYVGLSGMVPFVHDLETVLEGLKTGSFTSAKKTTDIILASIDGLKSIIGALGAGERKIPLPNAARLISEHLSMLNDENVSGLQHGLDNRVNLPESFIEQIRQYREILSHYEKEDICDVKVSKIVNRALKSLESACSFVKLETLQTIVRRAIEETKQQKKQDLKLSIDEIIAFITGMTDERKKIGQILIEDGKVTPRDLEEALEQQKNIGRILIDSGKVSPEDVQAAVRKQEMMEIGRQLRPEVDEKQGEVRTMRVDENKIERLANMLGEMVIARNTYEYLIDQLIFQDGTSSDRLKPLRENLHLFSRVTSEMQSGIMAMRMVPIKTVFVKFQRVVRDIGRKQNKDIELVLHGEETEVDKKIADMLSEPLVHMLRNACDHGIESRAIRVKAGKPEHGTVILNAVQEGRNIIIKIIDDGGGLNRMKIYEKALAMGLNPCPPEDDQIFQFIFHPGLSTKSEVSDISGRGVGMDVVRSTIRMLGGEIGIISEEGKGTEITLTIPMAIGISTALTVTSGGKHYAIPFDYVLETIKIPAENLHKVSDSWVFHYRGKVIAVNSLDLLLSNGSTQIETKSSGVIPLVMLKTGYGMFGIIVDKLERNMEIAIKPVPPQIAGVNVISGVTIMGDGKVILVLNPEKLFTKRIVAAA